MTEGGNIRLPSSVVCRLPLRLSPAAHAAWLAEPKLGG